ncbi:1,4-alpha-glucan branching protein GlgB [Zunongwangia sp. SCSIO 43204]|uniref:1,4-alpha-glucan branching protein GlgB n=1 Tax=Zunongwangia sp. SCSIO 43204 TaxID=2779359 RepID=UPI001CA80B34|nr:1,4-alpha-glucan branching protein GlgB [Zunongwangia sp. SCSIO 43204]UAB85822.1 1,4-alpha-glucan branching protein GlgB [Zunongwangia sp. SCSIO 43204]
MKQEVQLYSLFTDFDISLFKAGKHYRIYEKLGAHIIEVNGTKGTYFAVWAPSAKEVSVIGDFNYWTEHEHKLSVRWDSSGIWEGFIPGVGKGSRYKYKITSSIDNIKAEKADPYARKCEHPPATASIVWEDDYAWKDKRWLNSRKNKNALDQPISVYEIHLASWKRKWEENRSLSYIEMADELVNYVKEMGYTHVEFMPVMEYPYDPSWGYQVTGYFAPTSRFGTPDEFKFLVDAFHRKNIAVIMDWVPSHFPEDDHGLGRFDGSHLYEHPDRRKGYHPDWKSLIFNYGRNEVRSFLISNAIFWLDQYHIDGLRVDAVASMLYLDYSREEGEWEPNIFGGNENLEAISFLKDLNMEVYQSFEGVQTIAEESTAYSGVSKPIYLGGLGFGMKWMMGWMHDTLEYFKKDSIYRQYHQNEISFSLTYAFSENFTLPLSHDEVVYGKNSLLGRMPGDEWQRFANLRLMYGYMYSHPGNNLLFMGGEIGQYNEWNYNSSLDWSLLEYPIHEGLNTLVKDLNKVYKKYPALYEKQFSPEGFEWISYDDSQNSVLCYLRKGKEEKDDLIIICNFTPTVLNDYRIGVPRPGKLKEILNTDNSKYEGSGVKNKPLNIENQAFHGKDYSAVITVPPLASVFFSIE